MAKHHDIQKSRRLLKHLEEEMIFLREIMSQMDSLLNQMQFVSSGVKRTWFEIDQVYKDWDQDVDRS